MPLPNEHVARIGTRTYTDYRRENDKFGSGIDVIFGLYEDSGETKTDVASIHFHSEKFSIEEMQQWLKGNGYETFEIEPAKQEESKIVKPQYIDAPIMQLVRGKRSNGIPDGYLRVSSFASTEELDTYGTIITRDAMIQAWPGYLSNSPVGQPDIKQGPLRYMHDRFKVCGYCREWEVLDRGILAWDTIPNLTQLQRDTQSEILDGVLTGTSIGFNILKNERRDKTLYITRIELPERSVVDAPSNPGSGFIELHERARRLMGDVSKHHVNIHLKGEPMSKAVDDRSLLKRLKDFVSGAEAETAAESVVPPVEQTTASLTPQETRVDQPVAEATPPETTKPTEQAMQPSEQKPGDAEADVAIKALRSELEAARREVESIKYQFEWIKDWQKRELEEVKTKMQTEFAKIDAAMNGYKTELSKMGAQSRGSVQAPVPAVAQQTTQPSVEERFPFAFMTRNSKGESTSIFDCALKNQDN